MSPLLAAVDRNDPILFELCKRKDVLNLRNKEGKTALLLAAEKGNKEMVCSLLDEGEQFIEVEAQDVGYYSS